MPFGEKLRKLRRDSGLSQSALADALGVTRRSIIYYENGSRYPKTRDIIVKASTLFKVSVDYLVDNDDEFIMNAQFRYGTDGKNDAEEIVTQLGALFAGGTLNDDDKDKVFKAISDIYWESKEINRKYTRGSDKNK